MSSKTSKTEETTTTVSDKAAATRAAIGDRPRQSQVRLVEHYVVVRDGNPDLLPEFFSDGEIEVLESNASKVRNPITEAVEKATREQVDRSVTALRNEDALNGYANFEFDQAVFDDKTKEKTPRVKRSAVEKISEVLPTLTPEQEAELLALLQSRGHAAPTAG